jgi:L-malate glycosyltransferase
MKILFLGPTNPYALRAQLRDLSEERCAAIGDNGGTGLPPLVLAAVERGHTVIVVSLFERLTGPGEFSGPGLKYICLQRRSHHSQRDLFAIERRAIADCIRSVDVDIVNAHWTYEYALGALDAGHRATLITARDCAGDILRHEGIRQLPRYLAARLVLQRARALSTVSPYVYDYMTRYTKAPVRVIPNSVPRALWVSTAKIGRTIRTAGAPFWVISSLQWNKFKNTKRALLAFGELRRKVPDALYMLFGPGLGPDGPAQQWAEARGLAEGIQFMGQKSQELYLAELSKADVCLHPSFTEACSNTISEALVIGVPVVGGRRCGGVPWHLQWGRCGILVDPTSPSQMADALLQVWQSGSQGMDEMVNRGKEWAARAFSMDVQIRDYEILYQWVLERAQRTGGSFPQVTA